MCAYIMYDRASNAHSDRSSRQHLAGDDGCTNDCGIQSGGSHATSTTQQQVNAIAAVLVCYWGGELLVGYQHEPTSRTPNNQGLIPHHKLLPLVLLCCYCPGDDTALSVKNALVSASA